MTKRQWFLVAGTLVLAACRGTTSVCETVFSDLNQSRDEIGRTVECTDTQVPKAQAPAPKVNEPDAK